MISKLRTNNPWRFLMLVASVVALVVVMLPGSAAMAQDPDSGGNLPPDNPGAVHTTDVTISTHEPDGASAAALANILLLADDPASSGQILSLVNAITSAGYSVTVFYPEYNWNGSPSLAGFQCVIHLNGFTWSWPLSVAAQTSLVSYVQNGGCFVGTQFNGYTAYVSGTESAMADLVLQSFGAYQSGSVTLTTAAGQAGHPVLAGIPSPVVVDGLWFNPGPQIAFGVDPSTVLMTSAGRPAVLVREFGNGCVINFAQPGSFGTGLYDPTWHRLFVNAVNWGTSSSSCGNQPPTADANGPYLGAAGSPITFDGTGSSDPDPGDTLTYDWEWGDGTDSLNAGANPTHTYANAEIYDVCLTVIDSGGLSDTACTIAVVYDPSAGFVTGGGWIDSPAGAYVRDDTLAGKATFGFVSKYKKGATTPTGNTEFQFRAAALNFHSSNYEWLVVTGSDYARYKGVGTINGEGEYKFMLWAGDGRGTDGADTFRIRIWTEDEFGVETDEYDNGMEQDIGGGSIIVHTKK